MKFRNQLFKIKNPFEKDTDDIFYNAIKENFIHHYDNCPKYRKIMRGFGFSPEDLNSYDDIKNIPFIPTIIFKKHTMFSKTEDKIMIKATSSGTSGSFSTIGMSKRDLYFGFKMVYRLIKQRKLISLIPSNYIIFGYKMDRTNRTAISKTAFGTTLFSPALKRVYALKKENGTYVPDFEGVREALEKFSKSKFPVRLTGFPAYIYFLLESLDRRGIKHKFKKGSKIMIGGGWKQFYKEEVDKKTFYRLAERVFDIEEDNIIEFFSAVEHPVLYCDCKKHHFHVPAYSRVIIRDPETLMPIENGKPGLVNLITPMVEATPLVSIMTDDIGVLHDASECGCGIERPFLEIKGRIGMKGIKTCAAGAEELIKGVENDSV